jgi:hypothetical protein
VNTEADKAEGDRHRGKVGRGVSNCASAPVVAYAIGVLVLHWGTTDSRSPNCSTRSTRWVATGGYGPWDCW